MPTSLTIHSAWCSKSHAVQDWLDPRLADLSPSDLLFKMPEAGNAGLGGELCAPRSAFAAAAQAQPAPPPRALQPGSYTFGPPSAVPSYSQLDAGTAAGAGLDGLGSAGLVDAQAMQALTEELLEAPGRCSRTAGGWQLSAPGHGSAQALRTMMPPPPMQVQALACLAAGLPHC